jgi:hypothetical protein
MHPSILLMSVECEELKSNHHGVMTTEQTCQLGAPSEVQLFQIGASFNSVDGWNAQQESAIIMG